MRIIQLNSNNLVKTVSLQRTDDHFMIHGYFRSGDLPGQYSESTHTHSDTTDLITVLQYTVTLMHLQSLRKAPLTFMNMETVGKMLKSSARSKSFFLPACVELLTQNFSAKTELFSYWWLFFSESSLCPTFNNPLN